MRLPPQRSGQRDRADEPTGAGLGRLEGGPRNGPSLLLGRDRRAFRRVGAERRVRGARVAVDDLEVESLRQCVALVARRGHHLRGRDEDHSRGPSTISTLGHEATGAADVLDDHRHGDAHPHPGEAHGPRHRGVARRVRACAWIRKPPRRVGGHGSRLPGADRESTTSSPRETRRDRPPGSRDPLQGWRRSTNCRGVRTTTHHGNVVGNDGCYRSQGRSRSLPQPRGTSRRSDRAARSTMTVPPPLAGRIRRWSRTRSSTRPAGNANSGRRSTSSYSRRIAMSKTSCRCPASAASTILPGGPVAESKPETRTFVSRTICIPALNGGENDACG